MPHYTKAPIVEALIDIRVRLPAANAVSALKDVFRTHDREFEEPVPVSKGFFQVKMEAGQRPDIDQNVEEVGYAFRSADGKHFVQARRDGFSCSRLPPYDDWESFRDESRRLWDAYRAVTLPEAVVGATLKYVNRFDIPMPIGDFKDYFLTVPEVAPGLPQHVAGFFLQVQIPYANPAVMLVLTQTIVPPPRPDIVSVALDINLAVDNDKLDAGDLLWTFFEDLRRRKNEVFEFCITEKARGLIR